LRHGRLDALRNDTFYGNFLGGCVPYSDNPLTDPNKEKIDRAILGTWFWNEESDSGFVHIGLNKESKLLQVIMIEHDKDGTIDVSEFNGHTSSLGNNVLRISG